MILDYFPHYLVMIFDYFPHYLFMILDYYFCVTGPGDGGAAVPVRTPPAPGESASEVMKSMTIKSWSVSLSVSHLHP